MVDLEEDDPANLEEIELIKVLVTRFTEVSRSRIRVYEADIELLVLPAGPDMHGGGVNLLNHTEAPTLHL